MAPIDTEIDAISAARYLVMGQVGMDKLLGKLHGTLSLFAELSVRVLYPRKNESASDDVKDQNCDCEFFVRLGTKLFTVHFSVVSSQ